LLFHLHRWSSVPLGEFAMVKGVGRESLVAQGRPSHNLVSRKYMNFVCGYYSDFQNSLSWIHFHFGDGPTTFCADSQCRPFPLILLL
jgi:hypothetical protein